MNYRLYTWQLFQLSSMQQGIQALHVLGELNAKYTFTRGGIQHSILQDWQIEGKTVVCLNGGNLDALTKVYEIISELGSEIQLPYAIFHEDQQSLGGIATACGIIVPESIWGANRSNSTGAWVDDGFIMSAAMPAEVALSSYLRTFSLAS